MNKKYRLSLLHMIKEVLKATLIGGILSAVALNIIRYAILKGTFEIKDFFAYTFWFFICGVCIGLMCVIWGDDGTETTGDTGVMLYNVFAGVHNTFVFSNAGMGAGATFSIITVMFTLFYGILRFVYVAVSTTVVFPLSFLYLCIMAIFETIFDGIPETLGNILDKIIPISATVIGFAAMIGVLVLWGESLNR